MKRSLRMIALLLVLALMAGGTALVNKLNEQQSVSETEGSFPLTANAAEDLTGLQWTHEEVTYHFIKQDGAWKNADDAAFPANTNALQEMADDLATLTAERKLTDVTDPAAYGLVEPAFTVTAEWADGTSVTYAMGAETPFGDGYYLSLSNEENTAYAVEDALDDLFAKTGTELASLEILPEVADANRLTVSTSFKAAMAETSATVDETQLWYAADGTALKNNDVEGLVDDAANLDWQELLSAKASEEELSTWSLTEDTATVITLSGPETSLTVLIGAADDSGDYYARLPESSMVYTIASADVSDLLAANAADMRVTDLMPLSFEKVQNAAITANGQTVSFTGIPAETEETETEEIEQEEAPEKPLWTLIAALKADSFVEDAPQGDPLLVITAANAAGAAEMLTFYEYNADSYLVTTSGGANALTDAAAVDKIIRTFKQLV